MPISTKAAPMKLAKNHETGKWGIYVDYQGRRYWHLPTQYKSVLLRPLVEHHNAAHTKLNLGDRKVWSKPQNTSCQVCDGFDKLKRKEITALPDCPRCAGKGWMTIGDNVRWATYAFHNYT